MRSFNALRQDFPALRANPGLIYFDNAATLFKPQVVIDRITDYYARTPVNIHRGEYDLSFQVSHDYEAVRQNVADFIHGNARGVVFTAGATAALNMIAYGLGQTLKPGDVILLNEAEHASNLLPWYIVARHTGAQIEYVPLNEHGHLDIEHFQAALHERVKVVAMAQIGNVLGYELPIREMTRLAHQVNACMVVDGAQSVPHIPVDVTQLDVDYLVFSAHKLGGPTGTGVLYGKPEQLEQLDPLFQGGGANARFDSDGTILLKDIPQRFEAGTPDIAGVLGLGAALDYLRNIGMDRIATHEAELGRYLMERMKQLDHIILLDPQTPGIICSFNVEGVFAQDAAMVLNHANIAVRSGSHCAKILKRVTGCEATLRASLALYNTKEEIDRFVSVLAKVDLATSIDLIV